MAGSRPPEVDGRGPATTSHIDLRSIPDSQFRLEAVGAVSRGLRVRPSPQLAVYTVKTTLEFLALKARLTEEIRVEALKVAVAA